MWVQKVTGAGIDGLAYSPDGLTLYVLDGLGRFFAWDVHARTSRLLERLAPFERRGLDRLVISPDGRFIVALQPAISVAIPTTEGETWQHNRMEVLQPRQARFVPDGAVLVTLTGDRRQLEWWDLSARLESRTSLPGHPYNTPALSFDFSPDGRTVAVLGETGEVTLADASSGEVQTRFTVPKRSEWLAHVWFAPDGSTLLLTTEHQIVLWDLARGAVRAETLVPSAYGPTFALNPRLPVFAALDRARVLTLFGLETGKAIRSLDFALGRYVTCACFAPDGLTCAVGGTNRQFAVFDVDL